MVCSTQPQKTVQKSQFPQSFLFILPAAFLDLKQDFNTHKTRILVPTLFGAGIHF